MRNLRTPATDIMAHGFRPMTEPEQARLVAAGFLVISPLRAAAVCRDCHYVEKAETKSGKPLHIRPF
jgi:hypothetical protein